MSEICEVMNPGPHCVCHDKEEGECCYCVLGEPNCLDDENAALAPEKDC